MVMSMRYACRHSLFRIGGVLRQAEFVSIVIVNRISTAVAHFLHIAYVRNFRDFMAYV